LGPRPHFHYKSVASRSEYTFSTSSPVTYPHSTFPHPREIFIPLEVFRQRVSGVFRGSCPTSVVMRISMQIHFWEFFTKLSPREAVRGLFLFALTQAPTKVCKKPHLLTNTMLGDGKVFDQWTGQSNPCSIGVAGRWVWGGGSADLDTTKCSRGGVALSLVLKRSQISFFFSHSADKRVRAEATVQRLAGGLTRPGRHG